ncbi:MAG: tetratricopeptide repeat protein [Saprospiraceae bacterium]|nr:tetratricopeptide repeat protein [Candidatus Brachybacter algidus]MBP7307407.1 tetratricopeptide repeat protein [Saprospiraceae bacterium]
MVRLLFIFQFFIFFNSAISAQIETISTKDTTRYSEKQAMEEEKFIAATAFRLANKTKEAIPLLQELIKNNKTEPTFYYELARTYYLDKQYDDALTNASKSVSLDPANLYYAIFEAEILEKQGNAEMAASKYETIISKHPRVEEYWLKMAKLYNAAAMPVKSIETFERMGNTFGFSEEILFRKFRAQSEAGDLNAAVLTLEQLVKSFPDNLQAKNTLASIYKSDGREEDAKELYSEVLQSDPTNANANIALAQGMKEGVNDSQYLNSIIAIIENPQITIDSKISGILPFIDKYIDTQDTSLVSPLGKIATQLVKAHPSEAKAWAISGDIRLHIGQYTDALLSYDEALKLTQRVYAVYEQKMLLLTYLKRYEDLKKCVNEAMDVYPNQINNYVNLAFAELKLGHPDEALSPLSTAELMTGNNHPQAALINSMLAIAYTATNDKEQANTHFQRTDLLSKGNLNSMAQVAGMLAEFGIRLDLARIKIEAVTVKNDKDPFNAATASLIDFKEKNYVSSLKWIEMAINNGGLKYPSIAEQAGDVYFMSKNVTKAMDMWRLAKSMGVNTLSLDKKIASKVYIQ